MESGLNAALGFGQELIREEHSRERCREGKGLVGAGGLLSPSSGEAGLKAGKAETASQKGDLRVAWGVWPAAHRPCIVILVLPTEELHTASFGKLPQLQCERECQGSEREVGEMK